AHSTFMACVVWSIWKQRNNHIWNSVTDAQSFVYSRAATALTEWWAVQVARGIATV
ncbi:hypothetical protein A2U01_0064359, partial [Trifolium medium]|nr:hypothetical protein [Trifolium medium]